MAKTIDEYLSLPYTIAIRKDPRDDIYVARVRELQGCTAHGKSEQEALENIRENLSVWIEDSLENGDEIPVPEEISALPSGKWLQRVPRSLHSKLIALARKEGVSLNQLVAIALAEVVGKGSVIARAVDEPANVLPFVRSEQVRNQYSSTVSANFLFFREEQPYSVSASTHSGRDIKKELEAESLIESLASQMPSSGKFLLPEKTSRAHEKNTKLAYQA